MNKKDVKFKKMSVIFALLTVFIFCGVSWASVIETVPTDGATNVALNTVITVTFPEEMDQTTINTDTFFVQTGTAYGYNNVSGTVAYNDKTATFTAALAYGVTYKATVTAGVKTAADESILAADHTWSFKTATSAPGVMPVVSNVPAKNATGVNVGTEITVTFSEDMNDKTINGNTFYVRTGSGYDVTNVTGTVTYSDKVAKFTPASALSKNTTYTVTLVRYVKTAAEVQMSSDYIWLFTTGDTDTPAVPKVSSVTPKNGAADVAVGTNITATFSRDMNDATLQTAFSVKTGSEGSYTDIAGAVVYQGDTKTAVFTPAAALDFETAYTAIITSDAQDTEGNGLASDYSWGFTTAGQFPSESPKVISFTPENGAVNVAVNAPVKAVFSEDMDAETLQSAFTVKTGSAYGSATVSGTVTYNASAKTATFTSAANMGYNQVYTVTITTDAKSTAGKALEADKTWLFTTSTGLTGPSVNSVNPVNGAADAQVDTAVTVVFSEAMDADSVDEYTFVVTTGTGYAAVTVPGTVICSGDTAVFTPAANFAYETAYTVTVAKSVKNLKGETLAADYKSSFTTSKEGEVPTPPTVLSVKPAGANAAVDTTVTVTFSKAMKCDTVALSVSNAAAVTAGDVTCNGAAVIFTPATDLAYETVYTVDVDAGAEDLAGNALESAFTSQFTTIKEGAVPTYPSVGDVTSDETGVSVNFSKNMDCGTINQENLKVQVQVPGIGFGTVSGEITECTGSSVIFKPYSSLRSNLNYDITLTTGIKDSEGNALQNEYTGSLSVSEVTVMSGIFLDAAVDGIAYVSGSQTGYTDENGTFKYESGKTVTFSVGNILLGQAKGKSIITPIDLVSGATECTDPVVTNIIRFLQTLDADENPNNGILINDSVSANASDKSVDFAAPDFEDTVQDVINALDDDDTALVDAKSAQTHFRFTLLTIPGSGVAKAAQDILNETAAANEFPGAVMMFVNGDGRSWTGTTGVSDLADKTPMTADMKFKIGSITKTIIGMAILQLVDEGKIGLDDTINTLLPEDVVTLLEEKYDTSVIKVRHLLTHFSGIPHFPANYEGWFEPFYKNPLQTLTPEELVSLAVEIDMYMVTDQTITALTAEGVDQTVLTALTKIKDTLVTEHDIRTALNISDDTTIQLILDNSKNDLQPGDKWDYSNTNYILLSMILEKATGNTWADEIRNRFIQPLNLADTMIPETGDVTIPGKYAHGYVDLYVDSKGVAGEEGAPLTDYTAVDPSFTGASGNILATVGDLTEWIGAVGRGYLFGDDMQNTLFTSFINIGFLEMGLSILKNPIYNTIGHGGQHPGYDCGAQYQIDNDAAMAICVNRTVKDGKKSLNTTLVPVLDLLFGNEAPESRKAAEPMIWF